MNTLKTKMIWVVLLLSAITFNVQAQVLSLHTDTNIAGVNWDYYNDPCNPNPEDAVQDAIYAMPFDGASGHSNNQPDWPLNGDVNGNYSTMDMGMPGLVGQSLGVTATDINLYPTDQRDTRVVTIFNTHKIKDVNSHPGAVLSAKFKWSIDYVMPWVNPGYYLWAPTHLYVSIYPDTNATNYWRHDIDGHPVGYPYARPTTPVSFLQHEFDSNGLLAEKDVDIEVNEGPFPSITGIQPLTNWIIEQYGVQFYELDFTKEVRQLLKQDPNLQWIGFTIRGSLDGDSVLLELHAGARPEEGAFPPTLVVTVTTYLGDLNDDGSVDFLDFALFADDYGKTNGTYIGDLNVDGKVDIADLDIFTNFWLSGK